MARIEIPTGAGPELGRVWALCPEMAPGVGGLAAAVYEHSKLPAREREVARMRVAQLNDCHICLGWRQPELAAAGVTEELYEHVGEAGYTGFSEREQLAMEYAERFAIDHRNLDDAFFARMRAHFSDAEILDLSICLANWVGFGRVNQVLAIDEGCAVPAPAGGVSSLV